VPTIDAALPRLLRCDWNAGDVFPSHDADDWSRIVSAALAHDVAGLLCRVAVARAHDVPAEIVDAARTYLDEALRPGETRIAQTIGIVDALRDEGIETLPFTGVAMSALAPGDARLRPSADIDVRRARRDSNRLSRTRNHGIRGSRRRERGAAPRPSKPGRVRVGRSGRRRFRTWRIDARFPRTDRECVAGGIRHRRRHSTHVCRLRASDR
jgi:hypothetical protein